MMDVRTSKRQARMIRRLALATLLLAGLSVTAPVDANAQVSIESKGVRMGVSNSPGQIYFGGHVETAPLMENLSFRPNVELGVGNDQYFLGFNLEFAYQIPIQGRPMTAYLGAGPAFNVRSRTGIFGTRQTDLVGGFSFLVGVVHRDGLFSELKFGAMDNPGFKFAVGYTFQ